MAKFWVSVVDRVRDREHLSALVGKEVRFKIASLQNEDKDTVESPHVSATLLPDFWKIIEKGGIMVDEAGPQSSPWPRTWKRGIAEAALKAAGELG